ncbi:MAG: LCP family protein [Negativicutes bacterium]|nr:LCP family protein [Negativicutes bacterium]
MRRRVEKRARRKIRWPRLFLVLTVFLLMVSAIAGAGAYIYFNMQDRAVASNAPAAQQTAERLEKKINVLLLGLDDGDVEHPGAPRRSDTVIVASINPQARTINLLSIPRDTRVLIPGYKGYDKLAHAYAYGGPELTKRTVEEFLGIPIDYYVSADWQGFMTAVDILGGVDLYVERDMNYDDPYAELSIHLSKGFQHLDGDKAGQFVRFRHDELGDIGRVQRQQRFLRAFGSEMFQLGTIFKLPALTSTLRQHVSTDMQTMTLLKFANTVKGFSDDGIHTEMLPGNFATINGQSYWLPDKDQDKKVIETVFSLSPEAKAAGVVSGKPRTN